MFSFMLPVFCAGIAFYIAGVAGIPAALMAGAICRDGDCRGRRNDAFPFVDGGGDAEDDLGDEGNGTAVNGGGA